MRNLMIFAAALAGSASLPASAVAVQASSAAVTPGMPVVDTQGGAVGTVSAVKDDLVTVKTDRHEVALPRSSFTVDGGKLLFAMTQAQLNAETDKALEEARKSLVKGATVKGAGGKVVGTLESIDEEWATIKLEDGQLVRIPRSGIAGRADGAVIGATVEELKAQVQAPK